MKGYVPLIGAAGVGVVIYLLAREKFEPATPLSDDQKKAIEAMNKHAEKHQQ